MIEGMMMTTMSGEKVAVEQCKGINGLDKIVLSEARGSSAEVYLYGDQVTSWKNDHGEELLFMSSMGTKLQYALNLLATLPKQNGDALGVRVGTADLWTCSRKRISKKNIRTGFDQLQESMDRLLEQYNNKEFMGKMMLNQEEVFKEQVKELHRLYRVQKMLMTELRSKEMKFHSLSSMDPRVTRTRSYYTDPDQQSGSWSPSCSQTSHSYFSNNYHQTAQMPYDYNFHQRYNVRPDPSSQEPSSSSGETFRIHRGFDLEWPARGDTSTNISEIHDQTPIFRRPIKDKMAIGGISHDQCYNTSGENDVELTLSIGYGTDKKKSKHWPPSNLELGCSKSTPDETRQPILSTSVRLE